MNATKQKLRTLLNDIIVHIVLIVWARLNLVKLNVCWNLFQFLLG